MILTWRSQPKIVMSRKVSHVSVDFGFQRHINQCQPRFVWKDSRAVVAENSDLPGPHQSSASLYL